MIEKPRDLANRMAQRHRRMTRGEDGYIRQTFTLPRLEARKKAQDLLVAFPKAAYMTEIESWAALPDDRIVFTIKRLGSAD